MPSVAFNIHIYPLRSSKVSWYASRVRMCAVKFPPPPHSPNYNISIFALFRFAQSLTAAVSTSYFYVYVAKLQIVEDDAMHPPSSSASGFVGRSFRGLVAIQFTHFIYVYMVGLAGGLHEYVCDFQKNKIFNLHWNLFNRKGNI